MKKVMKQSTMTKLLNWGTIAMMVVAAALFITGAMKNGQVDEKNDQRYYLSENASVFMNASSGLTSAVREYAATGDEKYYNDYMKEINETKDRERGISNMQEIGLTKEEQQMVDDMMSLSNQLVPLEEKAMEAVKAGNKEEAVTYVFGGEYDVQAAKIKQLQNEFLTSLDKRSTKEVEDLKAVANVFQVIAIVFMVFTAIMQLVSLKIIEKKLLKPLGILEEEMGEIARGNLSHTLELEPDTSEIGMLVYSILKTKEALNRYIHDISDKLGRMASGDMTVNVDIDYVGDFEPIKNAIEKISSSLRDMLTQIKEAVEQVFTGAEQVSAGAQSPGTGFYRTGIYFTGIIRCIFRCIKSGKRKCKLFTGS